VRALLGALALLLPVTAAAAEPLEPIAPDRNGFSTATSTVGAGVFQLETGLAYGRERIAGESAARRFNVDLLVRVGVADRVDLGFFGDPLVDLRDGVETTDHGDFTLFAKWRFLEPAENSPLPSLGLLPFVKLPVAEEPIGSGKTDVGLLLLASFDLPAGFGLDLNAGVAAIGQSRPSGYRLQALTAAGLSYDVSESFMLFTDLFYASKESRDDRYGVVLDAGILWRPTRDVALDLSGVTSLAGTGPDWLVRAGVSVRFGR
jgi:Putative MetA-pathway of phenol degradation